MIALILVYGWVSSIVMADVQYAKNVLSQASVDSPMLHMEKLSKIRDPFKAPKLVTEDLKNKSDSLEHYPLVSLKVVGILTGPDRFRALIAAPDGKTFSVGERTKIGQSSGVIRKILDDKIVVQEKSIDLVGKTVFEDTELPLIAENFDVPSGVSGPIGGGRMSGGRMSGGPMSGGPMSGGPMIGGPMIGGGAANIR